jgi:hypothetical protein
MLASIFPGSLLARPLDSQQERVASGDPSLNPTAPLLLFYRLLQGRFDFKAPSLEQRLGNVLGILVPAGPFAQPGRPEILVRRELVLVHNLLEFRNGGCHWPDGLRLAPVRVSASLSHEKYNLEWNKTCIQFTCCIV